MAQFNPQKLDFVPITALELEDAGDRAQDVGLVVGPLLELTSVLLGSGVYYQHQGDLAGVEELEPVIRLLAGLFFDMFPKILLTNKNPTDECKVLYSRCVAELAATLLTLLRLDEGLCAFTEQKDALEVDPEENADFQAETKTLPGKTQSLKSAQNDPATKRLTFRRTDPAVLGPLVERGALFGVGRLLRQANARAFPHLDPAAAKFAIPGELVTDT